MSARDLPHGDAPACPHHKATAAGWKLHVRHETEADEDRRAAHISGACCTYPRPTRDGNPLTEETQP